MTFIAGSDGLRRGAFIAGSDGLRSWVTFKYERLPMFCHYCGLLGHDLHHYASHFARKKNGDEVDYQYGEWLKSEGGRAKSPPKRSANPRRGSDVAAEDGLGQNSNYIGVVVEVLEAERETAEHVSIYHDEGNLVNHRVVPESQQHENKGIATDFQLDDIARIEDNSNVE